MSLSHLLQPLCSPGSTPPNWEALEALTWADAAYCQAFGLEAYGVVGFVRRQGEFLLTQGAAFEQFYGQHLQREPHHLPPWAVNLWRLWLPLAQQIHDRHRHRTVTQPHTPHRPWVQGILGVQGTGKTTLATFLTWILQRWGHQVVSLSLDDFYKTHGERQQLQRQDPQLRWRGPPGTHDLTLACAILDSLSSVSPEKPLAIPRFDKSLWQGDGDRVEPQWITGADIVLLEGWCVGMRPVTADQLQGSRSLFATDRDFAFAQTCNDRLMDYLPLWQRLDDLLILAPQDYRWSKVWRQEAEERLRWQGRGAMTPEAVAEFVDYFWTALHPSLFLQPLLETPGAGLVVEVKRNRNVGAVYPAGWTKTG